MGRLFALTTLVALLIVALPHPALAGVIKVDNGTAASCTTEALVAALAQAQTLGDGTIRFKCGPEPVSITPPFQEVFTVPDNTTIDGDGLVTLRGAHLSVISVEPGATVVLRGLTLLAEDGAGAVANGGTLTVVDALFLHSIGFGCGGAIRNSGDLTVRRSTFIGNIAGLTGGAICNRGTAGIHNSLFEDNQGGGGANGGGAITNFGEMTVTDSEFNGNTAFSDYGGGAIRNYGLLTVKNSVFFQNRAGSGGAIFNDGGELEVRNTVVQENIADEGAIGQGHGGGILNVGGHALIVNSTIEGNAGVRTGGAVYRCCGGTTTIKKSDVLGNTPDNVVIDP